MKWNNRLKSVLTKSEKSDFSEDCLKTPLRITAKSPESEVSAVIRSDEFRHFPKNRIISDQNDTAQNLVSAVIRSSNFRESFKNNETLAEYKSEKLHETLNRFIDDEVKFDVYADEFLFIDTEHKLKTSDMEFLKINRAEVLCHLQQSLLMKHLFSHSPELLEDFAFEIYERESLLSITAKTPFEIYLEAVKQATRKWFASLLKKKDIAE